jgi:hypothetical protein
VFPAQWMEQDGPTALPTPSPDLDPSDFYLWGHLKSTVYVALFCYVQDLLQLSRELI